jgi:hypothetical protein
MPSYYLLCGIISTLMIILILRANEYNNLTGCWAAPSDFCSNADISMMFIYLGPGYLQKKGYLLMTSGSEIIFNNPIQVTLIPEITTIISLPIVSSGEDVRKYSLTIDWLGDEEMEQSEFFPKKQTLLYYPCMNKIVLDSKGTVHGLLYKDGPASDVAISALSKKDNALSKNKNAEQEDS